MHLFGPYMPLPWHHLQLWTQLSGKNCEGQFIFSSSPSHSLWFPHFIWVSTFQPGVWSTVLINPGQHGTDHILENPPQKEGGLCWALCCFSQLALPSLPAAASVWEVVPIPPEQSQQRQTSASGRCQCVKCMAWIFLWQVLDYFHCLKDVCENGPWLSTGVREQPFPGRWNAFPSCSGAECSLKACRMHWQIWS